MNRALFVFVASLVSLTVFSCVKAPARNNPNDPFAAGSVAGWISASDGYYADKVRVSWKAITGTTAYTVSRATASNGTYEPLTTNVTGTYFEDTNVSEGTVYYYTLSLATERGMYSVATPDAGYATAGGEKALTVMIYLDGDNDLEESAVIDFYQIEEGLANAVTSGNTDIIENMNVIVLFDRSAGEFAGATEEGGSDWTNTRLYRMLPDLEESSVTVSERLDDADLGKAGHIMPLVEMNMGAPETLTFFITNTMTHFPAERYALILWDHGGGTRGRSSTTPWKAKDLCYDVENDDALYVDEMQEALSNVFSSTNRLDFLGFDMCLMMTTEVAYEVRNLASYMAGSMNYEQGAGWEYAALFGEMLGVLDETNITGEGLAKLAVTTYHNFIENSAYDGGGETQSAIALAGMDALANAVDAFAVAMYAEGKQSALERVRDTAIHFYQSADESVSFPYYDLYDFCRVIRDDVSNGFSATLTNACNTVIDALADVVVYAYGDDGGQDNLQSYYFGDGTNTMRGLSIFISRGEQEYQGYTHYAYQWWYTAEDTVAWATDETFLYGGLDFCASDADGTVDGWRELFEAWYDPFVSGLTPSRH